MVLISLAEGAVPILNRDFFFGDPGCINGASLAPLDQGIEALTTVNPGSSHITGYNMGAMSFYGTSKYMGIQVGATYAINDMISVAIGGRYVLANNSYEGHTYGHYH